MVLPLPDGMALSGMASPINGTTGIRQKFLILTKSKYTELRSLIKTPNPVIIIYNPRIIILLFYEYSTHAGGAFRIIKNSPGIPEVTLRILQLFFGPSTFTEI